jgi:hypothetical protein
LHRDRANAAVLLLRRNSRLVARTIAMRLLIAHALFPLHVVADL